MGYRLAEAAWERGADVRAHLRPGGARRRRSASRSGGSRRPSELEDGGARGAAGGRRADHGRGAGRLPAERSERQQARPQRRRPRDPDGADRRHPRAPRAASRRPGSVIVGFALETGDALAKGRAKLERKDLDLIVVNDALEPGAGFEVDTNRVAMLDRDGVGADPAAPVQARGGRGDSRRRGGTPWPMSARRYLAQQIELGGAEVIVGRGPAMGPGEQPAAARSPASMSDERPSRRCSRSRQPGVPEVEEGRAADSGTRPRRHVARARAPRQRSRLAADARRGGRADPDHVLLRALSPPHQRGARRGQSPGAAGARRRGPGRDRGRDRAVRSWGRPASCSTRFSRLSKFPRTIGVHHQHREVPSAAEPEAACPTRSRPAFPISTARSSWFSPKVILALGGTAAEALLGVRKSLGELRGKVHSYNGIPLVVTYHPAALLRNPNWKKPTWDDVRIARQLLDR